MGQALAYVDLNPVRASIADSLEASDFTSIQQRLFEVAEARQQANNQKPNAEPSSTRIQLLPFVEAEHTSSDPKTLPFNLKDYIDLVDYTGRCVRNDKRGAISSQQPTLLSQLGLTAKQWRLLALDVQQQSLAALGSLEQLELYHASIHKRWMPRQTYLKRCYSNTA